MRASVMTFSMTVVSIVLAGASADAMRCSEQDAIKAEQEASTLKNWDSLYVSFKRFAPRCDDGAIGEEYSETVTRLLAKNWEEFPKLYRLSVKYPTFEKFVLSHIDETADGNNLDVLLGNARDRCPNVGKRLCAKIIERMKVIEGPK